MVSNVVVDFPEKVHQQTVKHRQRKTAFDHPMNFHLKWLEIQFSYTFSLGATSLVADSESVMKWYDWQNNAYSMN